MVESKQWLSDNAKLGPASVQQLPRLMKKLLALTALTLALKGLFVDAQEYIRWLVYRLDAFDRLL